MIRIDQAVYAEKPLAADEGFQFGRGVFETILILERPLLWTEHCRRLNGSLADLSIRPPIDADHLLNQIGRLGIRHCVLKILVSPENVVLLTRPLPAAMSDAGQRLDLQPDPRSNDPRLLRNKTVNYLPGLLAWQDARAGGFDDVLFYRDKQDIRECSRSNIFFVRAGRILTPDCSCGLLPGIVRQWIMGRYPVETGVYPISEILSADTVFITNSVIGIRSVSQIGSQAYTAEAHPITADIAETYMDELIRPALVPDHNR